MCLQYWMEWDVCLKKLIYASMYKSLCIKLNQLHNLSLLVLHPQGYLNITYLKCIMCVRMEHTSGENEVINSCLVTENIWWR